MKRYGVVLLLLGIMTAMAGMTRAAAQGQTAITLEIQAGYDGAYRLAEWFPVVVTIANDGPDLRGVLEWSFSGRPDEPTFQRTIDLPRGSRKRVTLEVFSRDLVRSGQVQLLDGDTVLAEQNAQLDTVDQGRFLIGVVSSDPALLNSLNSVALPTTNGATVRHLDISALPESTAALRALNVLFFHDVDSGTLTAAQRDALSLWIQLGGQLVVSGGSGGQRTTAGLADLLPVEVTGGVARGDLTPLAGLAGADLPLGTATTLSEARPRDGVESLPPGTGLLFRWNRGAGAVFFSAFDLAGLRGWVGEPGLWGRLLSPTDIFAPGVDARQRRSNLLQSTLRLPSLGLPSAGALFCFLIAYIIVVGPLNYLLLRRLRRLEWAWMTVPAAVLLFAAGLYVVGFGLRGGRPQINQAAIVQSGEGQPRGFATAFVGLFSPRRASYALTFPANTLVSEARSFNDLSNQTATALENDTNVEIPDVLVDIGAIRTFMTEAAVNMPVSVQSDVHGDGSQLGGQIRNTGSQPLENALIVRGTSFQSIGTIAPGAIVEVALSAPTGNFPWGVNLPRTGLFDRQQLLATLFESGLSRVGNPNNPNNQTIDNRSVYLLAWSDTPIVPMLVDGQETAQEGLALYIIRLNSTTEFKPNPLPTPPPASPTPATSSSTARPTRPT